MPEVHGGGLLAQALRRQGIQHVFTLASTHIQAIYDGCLSEGIRIVDTRHEQTAVHAAEGLSRVTGKPGVALVGAGAGCTNAVTGLANAYKSGAPLVCIAGAGPQSFQHMGALGELDAIGLMTPVCKWAARVTETRRIMEYVDLAFSRAQSGVPGPVYLELPVDVLMSFDQATPPNTAPLPPPRPAASASQIDAFAELLRRAGRPLFLLGSQLWFSSHKQDVERFADKVNVPFYLNGMARGCLPTDHSSLFHRTRRVAMRDADLIVVLGTPLDFRLDFGAGPDWNPHAKVVQVDLDAGELGHNRAVDLAIHADPGQVLCALLDAVGQKRCPEWLARLRDLEQSAQASTSPDERDFGQVCTALSDRLGPNDIVIGDGGDFVSALTGQLQVRWPQLWLDPGPLGTRGAGPGFAMAAAVCRPNAHTILLTGDGSLGFHATEFEAMVRQQLPVVTIVGNNAKRAQVQRSQADLYGPERVVASSLSHTRFDQMLEVFGGKGFWVEDLSGFSSALDEALESRMPSCINLKLAER